jgi:hypothetical protein
MSVYQSFSVRDGRSALEAVARKTGENVHLRAAARAELVD